MGEKLELTKAECEAVESYIWNHSRSSPNGTAYKAWAKMWELITSETVEQEEVETDSPQHELF